MVWARRGCRTTRECLYSMGKATTMWGTPVYTQVLLSTPLPRPAVSIKSTCYWRGSWSFALQRVVGHACAMTWASKHNQANWSTYHIHPGTLLHFNVARKTWWTAPSPRTPYAGVNHYIIFINPDECPSEWPTLLSFTLMHNHPLQHTSSVPLSISFKPPISTYLWLSVKTLYALKVNRRIGEFICHRFGIVGLDPCPSPCFYPSSPVASTARQLQLTAAQHRTKRCHAW